MNPQGTGASSLFESIDGLGNSGSVALLEQERQTLIEMTNAAKTLSVASKPTMTDPEQILEAQNSNTASSSQTTGGTGVATLAAPANPTAAQATAKAMLASFGFASFRKSPSESSSAIENDYAFGLRLLLKLDCEVIQTRVFVLTLYVSKLVELSYWTYGTRCFHKHHR